MDILYNLCGYIIFNFNNIYIYIYMAPADGAGGRRGRTARADGAGGRRGRAGLFVFSAVLYFDMFLGLTRC